MRVIVGLGNPGPEYAQTRHNVGQWVIREVSQEWGIPLVPQQWGQVGTGQVDGKAVAIMMPATWMNLTGEVVEPFLNSLQCGPSRLIVVHDDLDLPAGRLRIKQDGGSGGHNGLRSLDDCLGSHMYQRVKIGIGRPGSGQEAADFVLSPFSPEDLAVINKVVDRAVQALQCLVSEGIRVAMNHFNRREEDNDTGLL